MGTQDISIVDEVVKIENLKHFQIFRSCVQKSQETKMTPNLVNGFSNQVYVSNQENIKSQFDMSGQANNGCV